MNEDNVIRVTFDEDWYRDIYKSICVWGERRCLMHLCFGGLNESFARVAIRRAMRKFHKR